MVLQSDFDGLAGIATTITTSIVIAKCWGAYFDARMLFEPIFSSSRIDRFLCLSSTMLQRLTPSVILQLAGTILNCQLSGSHESIKEFHAHFGMAPKSVVSLWFQSQQAGQLPWNARPIHLLWALLHLWMYGTETTMSRMCKTNQRTFRDWVKKMVKAISGLVPMKVSRRSALSLLLVCFFSRMLSSSSSFLCHRSAGEIDSDRTKASSARLLLMEPTSGFGSRIHSPRSGTLTSTRRPVYDTKWLFVFRVETSSGSMVHIPVVLGRT